jgi:hypothetical protein
MKNKIFWPGTISLALCLVGLLSCETFKKEDRQPDISGALSSEAKAISEAHDTTVKEVELSPDYPAKDSIDAMVPVEKVAAYDRINFGMTKREVDSLGITREKIGYHSYRFTYRYDSEGGLYRIDIRSNNEKAIQYEARAQALYSNLCRVIAEKYGKKSSCGGLPSIFDVMNAQRYKMAAWEIGEKSVILYIVSTSPDTYYTECRIVHRAMQEAENARMYKIKNKVIIESSEKF